MDQPGPRNQGDALVKLNINKLNVRSARQVAGERIRFEEAEKCAHAEPTATEVHVRPATKMVGAEGFEPPTYSV